MASTRRPTSSPPLPPTPAVVRGLPPAGGAAGFFARHGNTILTGVLLALAAVLVARWWARSAEVTRVGVATQLQTARSGVEVLRSPALLVGPDGVPLSPDQVVAKVRVTQLNANVALSDVIDKADSAAIKARALVVRGDLDWAVANLPELPGASTRPALKWEPSAEVALGQSAENYAAALATAGADAEATAAAHLGLAAVAENRGDWAAATQHLRAVADDAGGVAVLSDAARTELAGLPTLEQRFYVAPPTGVPAPPVPPVSPVPLGPPSPVVPTTRAATVPARPTTVPTSVPATTGPEVPVVSAPSTRPTPPLAPATRPTTR